MLLSTPTLHPLDAAARLVPEDLVLLVERDGRLVFGGGSVCFPNRWDLRSKLGLSMAGVHAPVDRLNDQLEAPIDGFFDRLTPERSFWRLGWGVLDTADWYTPVDGTASPRPVAPAPDQHYLRVERETHASLPGHGLRALHHPHLRDADPVGVCDQPEVSRAHGGCARVAAERRASTTRIWRSATHDGDEFVANACPTRTRNTATKLDMSSTQVY